MNSAVRHTDRKIFIRNIVNLLLLYIRRDIGRLITKQYLGSRIVL